MIGAATDVYGLGAILYELLAGRPPFHAETQLDTLLLVLNDEPIPPSRSQTRIPDDLETICLNCLRKEPGARYPDGAALAEDLRRFLTHRPINARRVGLLGRARLWCRRKPTQAALTISVAILLVLIAVGATLAAHRLREELWTSYLAQARASRGTDLPGRSFDDLNALAKAAGIRPSLELRNEAIAAMASVDIRLVQQREVGPLEVTALAFDAALERYAVADGGETSRFVGWQTIAACSGSRTPDDPYGRSNSAPMANSWLPDSIHRNRMKSPPSSESGTRIVERSF